MGVIEGAEEGEEETDKRKGEEGKGEDSTT